VSEHKDKLERARLEALQAE